MATKCFDLKKIIMDQLHIKESDEIANEVFDYLQEDGSQVFKNMLNEEELDVIEHVYFHERAAHLKHRDYEGETQEEKDEKFSEAYKEWIEKTKYVKRKGKSYQYDEKQKRDLELRRINPYYRKITDQLRDSQPPYSYVDDYYVPNDRSRFDELARAESLIGRYPLGFRHYENYHNYRLKFPEATVHDYQADMNSKVPFDEFLAMKKAEVLYVCKYDPQVIYEHGFHLVDPEDPKDFAKIPENIVETEEFREEALGQY